MLSLRLFPIMLFLISGLIGASDAIILRGTTDKRQTTSSVNATCETGYGWTNNSAGIEPCVLAAALMNCNNANHTVPPLNPGQHYNPPSLTKETVNVCQCSWALYNLMSMCTVCQGEASSVLVWASYTEECGGFTESDSYFPSSVPLPEDAMIPLYAQSNPTQWVNGVFNVTQAKQIVDSGIALSTPTATHKAKPTATIIGASLGGVILLLLGFIGIVVCIRRKRKLAGTSDGFQKLQTDSARNTMVYLPNGDVLHFPVSFPSSNHGDPFPRAGDNGNTLTDQDDVQRTSLPSTENQNPLLATPFRLKYDYTPLLQSGPEDAHARPNVMPIQARRKTAPVVTTRDDQTDQTDVYDFLRGARLRHYSAPAANSNRTPDIRAVEGNDGPPPYLA